MPFEVVSDIRPRGIARGGIAVLVALLALFAAARAFRTINTGHVGVTTLFGKVTGERLDAGIHLVNPLKRVAELSVRTQEEFRSAAFWCGLVLLLSFHLVSLLWRWQGRSGDRILLSLAHLLVGIGFVLMMSRPDPVRDTLLLVRYTQGVVTGVLIFGAASMINLERAAFRDWSYLPLVAALMLSKNRTLKPEQIRDIVRASADKLPTLRDKVFSGGKVNAYTALAQLERTMVPAKPAILVKAEPKVESIKDALRRVSTRKLKPSAKKLPVVPAPKPVASDRSKLRSSAAKL